MMYDSSCYIFCGQSFSDNRGLSPDWITSNVRGSRRTIYKRSFGLVLSPFLPRIPLPVKAMLNTWQVPVSQKAVPKHERRNMGSCAGSV